MLHNFNLIDLDDKKHLSSHSHGGCEAVERHETSVLDVRHIKVSILVFALQWKRNSKIDSVHNFCQTFTVRLSFLAFNLADLRTHPLEKLTPPMSCFHYPAILTMRRYAKHDHHNSKHHQIISSAHPFASATNLAIFNLKHPKTTQPHSIENCGTFALTLLIGTRNRLLSGSSSNFFRASFTENSNGTCCHVLSFRLQSNL